MDRSQQEKTLVVTVGTDPWVYFAQWMSQQGTVIDRDVSASRLPAKQSALIPTGWASLASEGQEECERNCEAGKKNLGPTRLSNPTG